MHSKQHPRVATLCVLGPKPRSVQGNPSRIVLLTATVDAVIEQAWPSLDAVVLPGGFLRLKSFIGRLGHRDRCRAIMAEPFAVPLMLAIRRLDRHSPGVVVAIGCDSSSYNFDDWGDQTCIAFGARGVVGIARKIFPSNVDTGGAYRTYVPNVADYASAHRFVTLPSGNRAMLASCYDLFGLTEGHGQQPGRRSKYIRVLWQDGRYHWRGGEFQEMRKGAIAAWQQLLARQVPAVALCAIHGFRRPGLDNYWLRHGIAAGSAALGGAMTAGAAHFTEWLPQPNHSTLVANAVPRAYLTDWAERKAVWMKPMQSIATRVSTNALVRLYTPSLDT